MSSNVTNVWLDCDPGHDDAFAILLCDNPLIKLLGISTVHGNQTVEKTTANAIKTLALGAIWNIPVVAGLSKPVVVEARECPEIHGETGLDAPNSSFPTTSQKPVECDNAITYIKDQIMKCSSKVTVVATGCLTNVAMLLTLYPRIKERIDKIVVLGGAVGVGNISAAAEFNILVDPHAAHIVFESGCEIFLITIDTTHTNLVTAARTQQIKAAIGDISSFAKVVFDLLAFFEQSYRTVFGFETGPPLHDPLAVAFVIAPELFTWQKRRVDVELHSPLCVGRTVVDVYAHSKRAPNVNVIEKADIDGFWSLMIESLRRASNRRQER